MAPFEKCTKSHIYFRENCCEIWVINDKGESDAGKVRLRLAHELGHLVYNMDKLKFVDICTGDVRESEVYAWKFAYYLIRMKSFEYEHDINNQRQKFVYSDDTLKGLISAIMHENNLRFSDDVMSSICEK